MIAKKRFESDINSKENVLQYYRNKAFSLLRFGWEWDGKHKEFEYGVLVNFKHLENNHISMFIYKDYRKKGLLKKWYQKNREETFWTLPECGLEDYFLDNNIPFVIGEKDNSEEYKKVNLKFCDKYDNGLCENWMNLIDTSLFLLEKPPSKRDISSSFLSPKVSYFHDYIDTIEDKDIKKAVSQTIKIFTGNINNLSTLEKKIRDNVHQKMGGILCGY